MKKILLSVLLLSATLGVAGQPTPLLEKYRSMALDYNHDLKAAERNISASIELEGAARADRKPKLSADANFNYTGNPLSLTLDLPALGAPVSFEGQNMNYGASLSLLQPLYTGGRVLESIRMAQHQQSLASSEADVVRSQVCYQTDMQYWSTVARGELVGVAEEFRSSMRSLVKTIRERVEVGLAEPQDLLMAEVKLNEAEYQLLRAQSDFQTGRMALNSLIGISLPSSTAIDPTIPGVVVSDSLFLADGDTRPEVRMAESRVKMAETSLKLTDSKYKPQLYVGADGNYSSPGYNFNPDLVPNYAVYAKISIPIFEWGKRRSDKRASTYRTEISRDNLKGVEQRVDLELQTARIALMQAVERVKLSESSLAKAFENERKAVERYNEGRSSIVEVIDAQTYRQTSQIYWVQAKVAAQGYYSELIKAIGGYDSL